MIAKISLVLIAFVAVLGLVGIVQVPAASAVIIDHSYSGHVTSYNQATNTLVVNGEWGDKTFDVSNAHVNSMLLPNESVTVTYSENGGTMVASSVGVLEGEPYLGGGAYGNKED